MTDIPTCITVICNNIAPGAKIELVESAFRKKDTYVYKIGDRHSMLINKCKTHNGRQMYVSFGQIKCRVINDMFVEVAEVTETMPNIVHTIARAPNSLKVYAKCAARRYTCTVGVKTPSVEKRLSIGGAGFVIPSDPVFDLDHSALSAITDIIIGDRLHITSMSYSINLDREKGEYSFAIHKYSKISVTRVDGHVKARRANYGIGRPQIIINNVIDLVTEMADRHI